MTRNYNTLTIPLGAWTLEEAALTRIMNGNCYYKYDKEEVEKKLNFSLNIFEKTISMGN